MTITQFNTIKKAIENNKEIVESQIFEAGEFFNSDSHSAHIEIELEYNDEQHTIEGVAYGNYIENYEKELGTCSESEIDGFDVTAVFVDSTLVELTKREKEEINAIIKSL